MSEHQRRRCKATSSRSGEPCSNWAMKGQEVCHAHGGRSPQAKSAAARRLAAAAAAGTVAELVGTIGPVAERHPLDQLLEACDRVGTMVSAWGLLVMGLDVVRDTGDRDARETCTRCSGGDDRDGCARCEGTGIEPATHPRPALVGLDHLGDLRPHPAVVEYRKWLDLQATVTKRALDADIDERRVRLASVTIDRLVGAVSRAFVRADMPATYAESFRAALATELRELAA